MNAAAESLRHTEVIIVGRADSKGNINPRGTICGYKRVGLRVRAYVCLHGSWKKTISRIQRLGNTNTMIIKINTNKVWSWTWRFLLAMCFRGFVEYVVKDTCRINAISSPDMWRAVGFTNAITLIVCTWYIMDWYKEQKNK